MFDCFELEDLSALNEFDRHIEHSDLTEASPDSRPASQPLKTVEEMVEDGIRNEQLHKAISELPATQRRRFILYHI